MAENLAIDKAVVVQYVVSVEYENGMTSAPTGGTLSTAVNDMAGAEVVRNREKSWVYSSLPANVKGFIKGLYDMISNNVNSDISETGDVLP